MVADQRRLDWDERHKAGDFEGQGPNPTLVAAVAGLETGSALELAAGSGTNAVFLARQGWRTTAVDWSPVGLANGKVKADASGVEVYWLERNLFDWAPPVRSFDLVAIVYLHLPAPERTPVYARAAAAVARAGRLIVVGHHPLQAAEGVDGPDPERMFTPEEIGQGLLSRDAELIIERAEVIRRVPSPGHGPVDSLLVVRRP
jgi:SAM-dependent methyltransferase